MVSPELVLSRLRVIGLVLLPPLVVLDGRAVRAETQQSGGSCVDPSRAARAVVSITRYFGEPRRDGSGEVVGERATAWFYTSPRLLVTAAHFATGFPEEGWHEAELRQSAREGEPEVTARVQVRVAIRGKISEGPKRGSGSTGLADDVAIMELHDPFPNATVLDVQPTVPAHDDPVLVLGYPEGQMQAARGIVRQAAETADRYAGLALLEVQGANRLLLDNGASGAPVLDCGKEARSSRCSMAS